MTVVGRDMYSDNGGERDVYTVKMAGRERERCTVEQVIYFNSLSPEPQKRFASFGGSR